MLLVPPVRAKSLGGKPLESRSNTRSTRSNSLTPKASSGGVVPLDDVTDSPWAALRDRSRSYGLLVICAAHVEKQRPAGPVQSDGRVALWVGRRAVGVGLLSAIGLVPVIARIVVPLVTRQRCSLAMDSGIGRAAHFRVTPRILLCAREQVGVISVGTVRILEERKQADLTRSIADAPREKVIPACTGETAVPGGGTFGHLNLIAAAVLRRRQVRRALRGLSVISVGVQV